MHRSSRLLCAGIGLGLPEVINMPEDDKNKKYFRGSQEVCSRRKWSGRNAFYLAAHFRDVVATDTPEFISGPPLYDPEMEFPGNYFLF